MSLSFDTKLAEEYRNQSQRVRVLTEDWVDKQMYCPHCGHTTIEKYANNKPVADFYCDNCHEEYELKSKQKNIGKKIVDGAYQTMIEGLLSSNNPNFFLLNYDVTHYSVTNFIVIPKHFFIPEIIEKRNPLAKTARRAGWIGCSILLNYIPQAGRIFLVRDGQCESKENVLLYWKKTLFLREETETKTKGWLIDMMRCIESIGKKYFILEDLYKYEAELSRLHPENRHIKDKIRQQLQVLRDRHYLEFVDRGIYAVT